MTQLHVSRFRVASNPDMAVAKEGIKEWLVLLVVVISRMPFCMFKRLFLFLGAALWKNVKLERAESLTRRNQALVLVGYEWLILLMVPISIVWWIWRQRVLVRNQRYQTEIIHQMRERLWTTANLNPNHNHSIAAT